MNRRWMHLLGAVALLALALGCGKKTIGGTPPADQLPLIQITSGAVNSDPANPLLLPYSVHFQWLSNDPDGFVDHYVYTVLDDTTGQLDTMPADSAHWKTTKLHEAIVQFPADTRNPGESDSLRKEFAFTHPQEFAVAAVDNQGKVGHWDYRYFTAYTVAPTTSLLYPKAGQNFAFVGPTITARWKGNDPDSPDPSKRPVQYLIYFKDITPGPAVFGIQATSDFIRQTLGVVPIKVRGDSTSLILKLTVGHAYCIVVKSVDTAGAVEPYPTLNEGADEDLRNFGTLSQNTGFFKASSQISGPTLVVQAGLLQKTFVGYDPTNALQVEQPVNVPEQIQWLASAASYGGEIATYRYALDIDDPTSESPRVTQPGGFVWTAPDARALSAVLPGFTSKGIHTFYIEATDNSGFRTIGIVQVTVVEASFEKPLLYVLDDVDQIVGNPYISPLMTQSELEAFWRDILETDRFYVDISDTLTYPGGRCTPMTGQVDFLRPYGNNQLQGFLPLSTLAKYRVIIWYAKENHSVTRSETLYNMVSTGPNNLFTYLQAGGNIWMYGGGIAEQLAISRRYPITPLNVPQQKANGPFVLDVLGIRGDDTLFNNGMVDRTNEKGAAEYDGTLRAIDPAAIPFQRETAFGKESRFMPGMSLDFARYDTLCDPSQPDSVQLRCPLQVPIPILQETLTGTPDAFNANPDSAFWQPTYLFRTVGPQAVTTKIEGTNRMFYDGSTTGWYRRGQTLTTSSGGSITAPFQLYYFGVNLNFFPKEDLRAMADIILSTRGWNIWRGACPSNGPTLTIQRQRELQAGWARIMGATAGRPGSQPASATAVRTIQRSR